MKILYILHDTSIYSGSTKSFMNLILYLKNVNTDFMVICPNKQGIYQELVKRKIPVKALMYKLNAYPSLNSLKNIVLYIPRLVRLLLANWKSCQDLYKIATAYRPDIIHTNVSVINIGYKTAKRMNIPHVWHIRQYIDTGLNLHVFPDKKTFKKELNSNINHLICITKGIQDFYNLTTHSTVIYDGVLSRNTEQYKKEKKKYFLFAGRIEENKGIKDVITAYGKFSQQQSDTNIQLWIAGDTKNTAYYNETIGLVEKMNIASQVVFLGMRKDIYSLMKDAMALIVPSYWEGFGFITAEAMFNGCLVIGRNTSGTKEQFDNGLDRHKKEIALRFNTQKELENHMKDIATNGIESYFPIIDLAKETVLALYTIEDYTKTVYDYYREIVKNTEH